MIYQRSSALFAEAKKYIPGGVNSPVRAFKAVGGDPIFVKEAKGAYLYDVDGTESVVKIPLEASKAVVADSPLHQELDPDTEQLKNVGNVLYNR